MWLENFLWSVEQESEGQENFDIRTFLKYTVINVFSIFQLVDAYGVGTLSVADSVQWIQNL